jgi:UDP-hydrolysing UDP-N-acetyl-D-glucosamine 2-epimerase
MRKVGVVTTSRADYGLYFPILKRMIKNQSLELLLFVTGMHLCDKYGHTVNEIEQDGFSIAAKVDMLGADSPLDVAKSMGRGTMGFADVYNDTRPDILLVLGDRFEMHCAAVAAIPFGIPIAHIHGGECTYGAFDEYFRHSLTKMSHLHFASTEAYAQRIRQMGEEPWRVIVSGAPAIDNVLSLRTYTKDELEDKYEINLSKPVLLTTFHPVSSEYGKEEEYIQNLLAALEEFQGYSIVFTSANADPNNHVIADRIRAFMDAHGNSYMVDNFGRAGYLSMMKVSKAMVGNSSSGIIEAASFHLPVVNIGTRQDGRIRTRNVIDVGYSSDEIKKGIRKAVSDAFHASLADLNNPYGDGKASERIVSMLETVDLKKLNIKRFCDLGEEIYHG